MSLLPHGAARETLNRAGGPRTRCAPSATAAPLVGAGTSPGALAVSDEVPHTYAYYFLPLGTWDWDRRPPTSGAPRAILYAWGCRAPSC